MIFDCITHINNYRGIHAGLDHAIQLIINDELELDTIGKVGVEGNKLFYLVQEYSTSEPSEVKLEAHKRYIDLQLIIEGNEIMEFANKYDLDELTSYDEENDIQFFKGNCNRIHAKENYFAVYFPHDGHRAGIASESSIMVKKIVFKIEVG